MTRWVAFFVLGLVLICAQGVATQLFDLNFIAVDVPVTFILYWAMGQRRSTLRQGGRAPAISAGTGASGALLAIALGYCRDLLEGAARGIHTASASVLYIAARRLAYHLDLGGVAAQLLLVGLASCLASGVAILLGSALGSAPTAAAIVDLAWRGLATGLSAPLLIRLLQSIDRLLEASPGLRRGLRV